MGGKDDLDSLLLEKVFFFLLLPLVEKLIGPRWDGPQDFLKVMLYDR